jgi:hypothetical protein
MHKRLVAELMVRTFFALSGTALLAGCIGGTEPQQIDYGLINIVTTPVTGGYRTAPVGLFVHGSFTLPGTVASNLCALRGYTSTVPVQTLNYVSAGNEIALQLSGNNTTLIPRTDGDVTSYVLPVPGSSISFTPGDTAFLSVPGASGGFPAAETFVRTAEPFTMQPVPVGTSGDDVPLQWTAAPHPNSVMVVSLRYALAGSAVPNEQIYCELVDDGAFTIATDFATSWQESTTKLRSVVATRYRATVKQVGSDILHVAALFNVTGAVQ